MRIQLTRCLLWGLGVVGGLSCSGKTRSADSTQGAVSTSGGAGTGGVGNTSAGSGGGTQGGAMGGGQSQGSTSGGNPSTSGAAGSPETSVPKGQLLATQVAANAREACALTPAQEVVCWGARPRNTLEDVRHFPERMAGLGAVSLVSSSDRTTCVLLSDGGVSCWGAGEYGQLGNGVSGDGYLEETPVVVEGLDDVVDLVVGGPDVCAVTGDGAVWCWGDNAGAKLGFESESCGPYAFQTDTIEYFERDCQSVPKRVPGIETAISVGVGMNGSCAVLDTSAVVCWGSLADPQAELVVPVSGLSDVAQLAVGSSHRCALTHEGGVWCWGNNSQGQVGLGDDSSFVEQPSHVLDDVVHLAVELDTTCAVKDDGRVYCWGRVFYAIAPEDRQDPNSSATWLPEPAPYAEMATSAAVGTVTCVITSASTVHCWGASSSGSTGNGHFQQATDYTGDPVLWDG